MSELDPKGERDVSAEYPDLFADMKHRLFEWIAHDSERRIENEHLVHKREGNIPPVAVALP